MKTIARSDVIAAIGYDGEAALVDRLTKRKYGKLTTAELVEKGLYRAAAASAIHSGKPEDLTLVAESYSRLSGSKYRPDQIPRLFGVAPISVQRSLEL